jgi:2-dehydropantoate 2-reductase
MIASMGRIIIYGAGSIGCYIGGRLEGQTPIRYIGRERALNSLREHGLAVSDYRGHQQLTAPAALDLRAELAAISHTSLVLVCVKSAATAEAAHQLAAVLKPGTLVISLQNGLHNADVLRNALPKCRVLAGMVPFNVVQRAPGVFHQASSGELMVQSDKKLAAWLAVFANAGLPLELRHDMEAVQRAKLLLNLNNAINALSDLPLRDELSQRGWRRCLALAQREALGAFRASGLSVAKLTPLPPSWMPAVLTLPDAFFSRIASRMLAIDPLARSSTWDDLKAGRLTEVDYINGEIARLTLSQGNQSPVNAKLCELIHAAEHSQKNWSSEALLAELLSARQAAFA